VPTKKILAKYVAYDPHDYVLDGICRNGYMLDERVVKMEDKIGPVYANTPDRISAKRHTVYGQTI
jgi:hypothetical protein